MSTIIEHEDLEQKSRKWEELKQSLMPFNRALAHLYTRMPFKTRFYPETNEVEQVIDPEYQKLIDKINYEKEEFIRISFPEFYNKIK